jgi:hypothetical protein
MLSWIGSGQEQSLECTFLGLKLALDLDLVRSLQTHYCRNHGANGLLADDSSSFTQSKGVSMSGHSYSAFTAPSRSSVAALLDFLVQSSDPLALLYNDRSPLENHHVSAGTRLMAQPVSIRTKVGICSYCKSGI